MMCITKGEEFSDNERGARGDLDIIYLLSSELLHIVCKRPKLRKVHYANYL
ncbi:hypothetical protein VCR4J2_250132 [Vibrio coralliirubri]|nr:hypothetical protein VCR4J2_250132 [Vibrio coralliirubri]